MNIHTWRPHMESALSLSVGSLFKAGALLVGATTAGGWQWSRDGKIMASIGYSATLSEEGGELRLSYTWARDGTPQDTVNIIRLSSLPLHYGGRRWYMHCPVTGRRALKLYRWSGTDYFCHRTAIRPLPTYASQRTSGSPRIINQRWALRHHMGDTLSDLFGEPHKPKWMRLSTFQRYVERDTELADMDDTYSMRLLERLNRSR